jgi:hypothetical protein
LEFDVFLIRPSVKDPLSVNDAFIINIKYVLYVLNISYCCLLSNCVAESYKEITLLSAGKEVIFGQYALVKGGNNRLDRGRRPDCTGLRENRFGCGG